MQADFLRKGSIALTLIEMLLENLHKNVVVEQEL